MIDKNKILNSSGPKKISKYLADNNLDINLVVLDTTARTAVDAAKAIGVQVGAIVKSLVFNIKEDLTGDDHMILALIAGDRQCDTQALGKLTGYDGKLLRPDADFVKDKTGYSIGGVSPLGLPSDAKIYIDKSLNRFKYVYGAAGHPDCVFKITYDDLIKLTNGLEKELAE